MFSALLDLDGDKAIDLDGFSMNFQHFSWHFVKNNVMGFFKECFDQGRFKKSLKVPF